MFDRKPPTWELPHREQFRQFALGAIVATGMVWGSTIGDSLGKRIVTNIVVVVGSFIAYITIWLVLRPNRISPEDKREMEQRILPHTHESPIDDQHL